MLMRHCLCSLFVAFQSLAIFPFKEGGGLIFGSEMGLHGSKGEIESLRKLTQCVLFQCYSGFVKDSCVSCLIPGELLITYRDIA